MVAGLVVAAEKLVGWVLEALIDSAGGGMTLKLTVAFGAVSIGWAVVHMSQLVNYTD